MRDDPIYLLWTIQCPTAETARQLRERLQTAFPLDRIYTDEVRVGPDTSEVHRRDTHRLGDYFERVEVLSGAGGCPESFGLLFQRHRQAGRFWKDFMVRLLAEIQNSQADTRAILAYRGNEEPAAACPT